MRNSVRLIVLTIFGAIAMAAPSAQAKTPKVGEVAPNFELALVNGQKVTLADLRGQVVVLNFWATWCVPCRTELPTLDAYYQLQKKHALRVFAVTTENSVPEKNLHSLFSVMTVEPIHKLKGPYSYIDNGVPTNYVIDRSGKLRYAKAGAFDLARLNAVLLPLLAEPVPSAPQVASTR